MIFTLYYMYATALQWWRLRSLKNKLSGTLHDKNALLICHSKNFDCDKRQRSIDLILFRVEDRIACTVVPKQNVDLTHWASFPKDPRAFPIHIEFQKSSLSPPFVYLLIRTHLENYIKHDSEAIQIEHFGEPVAWKAVTNFEILLKTNLENLTKLVQIFWNSAIDINHDLAMLEIESVNIEGRPKKIKYRRKYSLGETVKYSHSTIHWKRFANNIKGLYLKIYENSNPNHKRFAIYNMTHIKKDSEKQAEDNTLCVSRGVKKSTQKESSAIASEESTKVEGKDRISKTTVPEDGASTTKGNENKEEPSLKHRSAKPPNILVYADSGTAKENVKALLNSVINREKYIVYDLPTNISTDPVWCDATVLVVICGEITPELTPQFLHYLVNGGQILCLCSDFLHSILGANSTAGVKEDEVVKFSYGKWKSVKMMHRIFSYQSFPIKQQLSEDLVQSNRSPVAPFSAEIQHNGKNYSLQVQVLGTEETWQTPSILLANVKNSNGRVIFAQVHLEVDPLQYERDEYKYSALKESNNVRLEILTDILINRLDIDCTRTSGPVVYIPGHLLGSHDMKMEMINECKEIVDNTLNCEHVSVVFCGKNVDPGEASATRFPIMLFSSPSSFSTVEYFSALNTYAIGRLVIYADILRSTHYVLGKTIKHGLVVIAKQQSGAIGRSNNIWLSPLGGAWLSLQLHVPLNSPLGKQMTLMHPLASVAIIEGIKKNPGYEKLDIGIKWPNDIYVNGSVKIGGVLTTYDVGNKVAVVNIGCGLNLDNSHPTICLNDYVDQYNAENKTNLQRLSHEKYFATIFNELERLYDFVQNDNLDHFYDLYYKNWIHQDAKVKIRTEDEVTRNATVIGIDDFGYLKVKLETGEITVVHPDGNTFDRLKGLISPKPSYNP